ncbi:MAG: formate dehydrogenase subunit gamma [Caldimonas sp.]
MLSTIRHAMLVVAACVGLAAPAFAQDTAGAPRSTGAATPPQLLPNDSAMPASGVAAVPDPQPADTNAQRARSQPGNNAPFWRGVHDSGKAPGTVNNLNQGDRGVLIQPFTAYPGTRMASAGEAWRQIRNGWIIPYGGSFILIVILAIALFYFAKGPIGGHERDTGRVIERFTYFERAAHWSNAIAFVVLAVSGIVMAFGQFFLLPILGGTLFGLLTYALKTAHNFAGPLFAVSLLIVFLTFLRSNWPSRDDLTWLVRGGGLFGGEEPPSHRFNAGEKLVFWGGVLVLGSIVVGSGLVLDKLVPGLAYLRDDMQVAHIIHSIAAVLMIAVFLAHTYLGTIGMRGSYRAMKTGYVDEAWAHEHHRLWQEDIQAGRIPAQRTPPPAGPVEQPAS